jgi:hypothetical protein
MQNTRINPLIRLFPSLTDVAFLMPIFYLFAVMDGAKTMLGDGDTGWHIRTGDWILANGTVPSVDIFSYTKPGEPWFAWEWLWDVAFAYLHQQWGMEAVVLTSILVLCVTFALLFRLVTRSCGNALAAATVTILAMMASALHWLARPHLFTLLFSVIFLGILYRVREGRSKLLVALPLLTVVWTNIHGGFLVGIILIAAFGVGELLQGLVEQLPARRREHFSRSLPYLVTAAGCLVASLLNPYGYKLHAHIVEYLGEPYHFDTIIEFLSPSFHPVKTRFIEALLALGIGAAFVRIYRRQFAEALLILFWAHSSLVSARNIPIYVLIAAPAIAQFIVESLARFSTAALAAWCRRIADEFLSIAAGVSETDRVARVHLVSLTGVFVVGLLMYSPAASGKLRATYDPKLYPERALSSESVRSAQAIFTDGEWGDYLIYRLFPHTKVFTDGRSDFYGPAFGREFLDVLAVKHNWERMLLKYGVDTVLLPADSALSNALKESAKWRLTYDDGVATVFRTASTRHTAASQPGRTSSASFASGKKRGREITKVQQAVISRSLNHTN